MPRVLMIQYSMVTGGAGMQVARLAEGLVAAGHEVDVVGMVGSGGAAASGLGKARLLTCPLGELLAIAAERPYDIIDAAWPLRAGHCDAIQGVLAACRWSPRLIIRCHSEACFLERHDSARTRLLLRIADRVIFHHERQRAEALAAFNAALDAGRCVIAPPGVNVERFAPEPSDAGSAAEYARRFGLFRGDGRKRIVVAMAGRPSAEKSWLDYCILARRLRDSRGDNVRCLAVTGPQRGFRRRGPLDDLVALNAQLGAPLTITGLLDDWENLLASVDVYVQMSCSESFCRTAAEAQACGVPVVASNVGGLGAVAVKHHETGLLVDLEHGHRWREGLTCRDRDGFYKAIRSTIGTLKGFGGVSLKARCRQHAIEDLDDRRNTAWHVEMYKAMLTAEGERQK